MFVFLRSLIPVCALVALLAQTARADVTSNALGSLKYRELGPAISGGRTTAVAGSDQDPLVYYAGGAGGGVFKSSDGGASWNAVFDRESAAPIGALAVSPNDARDVWVGTGESNPRNDVEEGAGVWHSTDGGTSWRHVGLEDAGSISSIALDPRDPRVAVVGVLGHVFRDGPMRGVYLTRDGGTTWRRTLYVGPASGASDVERVPDRPATLFAGIWQFRRKPWNMSSGGPLGGLYRSDDGGARWRKVTGGGFPAGLTGRIGLAPATAGRIYAIVQSLHGNVWRSDDGGTTWRVMPHSPLVGARPFYFSRLFVDPSDRDRVINVSLILSLSTDGGRSFHKIATNGGWDYHAVWWSGDGRRILNGSDEGVIISADGGRHWWQPYDLPFAQPYHVGFDRKVPSYNICIGLQDDNSWCAPSTADNGIGLLNRDWHIAGPGDGMWAVFDLRDPRLVWTTSTNSDTGQVFLYDPRTRQTREVSPDATNVQGKAASLKHRFNWDTPIAFTSDGKALVGANVVFESADYGEHWTTISPDLTRDDKAHQQTSGGPIDEDSSGAEIYDTILQIAPSQEAGGPIWIGTDDGLVQLTRDGGASWKNVTPAALPTYGRVYTVEPGHGAAGTAYVAVDHHLSGDDRPYIFLTDDYGATWKPIAGDLPRDFYVRSIREDRLDRNLLYAGTRRGVFVSFDRGAHWHSLRLNMPATAIYDLQLQPDADDLIVAAHGRGVWILDDLRPLRAWAGAPAAARTFYAPRDAYRMWRTAPVNTFLDSSLPDNDFVGNDRPYGAVLTYYLPRAARHVAIEVVDSQSRIVKHLFGNKVTGHAGMNRAVWDMAEDGPVRWSGTFEQNQGPKEGAEALPGPYTVRVVVDGKGMTQPLVIVGDPRQAAAAAELVARHDFLRELNAEISGVDTMLNALDRRSKHAGAKAAELAAFKAQLTIDPRNIEDLKGPPGLRERLLDLLTRVNSTSFQAPTEAQSTEARTLRDSYAASSAAYARL